MRIGAIILAAGRGGRIGTPKLKLEIEGSSFLSLVLKTLQDAGIEHIICVVESENREWIRKNFPTLQIAINPNTENGMVSSISIGIREIQKCEGYLIVPIDHPFIKSKTIKRLKQAFSENLSKVVKPLWNGRSGHPVMIPSNLSACIPEKDVDGGLNWITRDSGVETVMVPVDDEGISKNVNTKDDLKEYK
jgi:CTP:molybdopterin cytidylyltransferase MocA